MSTEIGSGNRITGVNAIGAGAASSSAMPGSSHDHKELRPPWWRRTWAVVLGAIVFFAALFGALNDGAEFSKKVMAWCGITLQPASSSDGDEGSGPLLENAPAPAAAKP